MRASTYLRVSKEDLDQRKDGTGAEALRAGIEAQRDACTRWVLQNCAQMVGPFTDEGVSGATEFEDRPGLFEAINELKRGDILLVAKRDRIARDEFARVMIEHAVRRRGARIVSVAGEGTEGDEPHHIFTRRILDAAGEYERLLTKARTSAALQAKIRRGHRVGEVRYGHTLVAPNATATDPDHNLLRLDPAEQTVIAWIRQWRSEGLGAKAIAKRLTEQGVPTKKGNSNWCYTSVQRILKRAV